MLSCYVCACGRVVFLFLSYVLFLYMFVILTGGSNCVNAQLGSFFLNFVSLANVFFFLLLYFFSACTFLFLIKIQEYNREEKHHRHLSIDGPFVTKRKNKIEGNKPYIWCKSILH